GEELDRRPIDRRGQMLIRFGVVDSRKGGAVDDHIRPGLADRVAHRARVSDVEVLLRQSHNTLTASVQGGAEIVTHHSARPGDEPPQRHAYFPPPVLSCTLICRGSRATIRPRAKKA